MLKNSFYVFRLLKDSADSTTYRTEALENVEKQLKDAEFQLEREKHAFKKAEVKIVFFVCVLFYILSFCFLV